jgi:hypothetical protein
VQPTPPDGRTDAAMKRSYIRVLLAWAATLAALYLFQELFA